MSALPVAVLLQAQGQSPSPFGMLIPMAAIFLIFYFLLIRPQQRRQREQQDMLKALDKGDWVMTAGGLHGVGSSVVNALSSELVATVKRDGAEWRMEFHAGGVASKLKRLGAARGISAWGREEGAPLLRLKALAGDVST